MASFNSSYGYTFNEMVPFKKRMMEYTITNTPLRLRPFLRKFKKSKKLLVKDYGKNLLKDEFVRNIISGSLYKITDYINVEMITDDSIKSRALTLELLLRELNVQ
jgi:hypothetical protein